VGKKSGSGGAVRSAGVNLSRGRMRGGGGGTAADAPAVSTGSVGPGLVLAAWSRYGKYVVRPIARLLYGSQKKYKIGGQRVGQRAYQRYQQARRANLAVAAATGGTYIPPTEAEWKRRAEAVNAPRPRQVPPKTPTPPPPPPPPKPPARAPRRPFGGPGSVRGQIVAYVVANGILWGITKAGEWIRQREATAAEVLRGSYEGGGPRRGGRRGPAAESEPLTPIQIFQRRLPVPRQSAPRVRVPKAAPSPQLEPVVITAQRLPVPVPAKPVPTWLKILKAVPAGTNPLQLFQSKKASKAARQLGRALTALETRGVTSSLTQSNFSSFSGFGGGTPGKTRKCECPPKRKRKPKKPREICYTGTYTERANGLTKLKRRKVRCRLSAKK